ncbi:hypothetical protein C0J52_27705 [Blattella germanica]|nr:hypothetical protein C0J52_27705 [Blattella germanica]
MGGPGSGSSELSAENTRNVTLTRCLEPHDQHQLASTDGDNSCKKGKKKGTKMPQYRPRKGGAAGGGGGGGFDDGTINGDYRRPRRIRKR